MAPMASGSPAAVRLPKIRRSSTSRIGKERLSAELMSLVVWLLIASSVGTRPPTLVRRPGAERSRLYGVVVVLPTSCPSAPLSSSTAKVSCPPSADEAPPTRWTSRWRWTARRPGGAGREFRSRRRGRRRRRRERRAGVQHHDVAGVAPESSGGQVAGLLLCEPGALNPPAVLSLANTPVPQTKAKSTPTDAMSSTRRRRRWMVRPQRSNTLPCVHGTLQTVGHLGERCSRGKSDDHMPGTPSQEQCLQILAGALISGLCWSGGSQENRPQGPRAGASRRDRRHRGRGPAPAGRGRRRCTVPPGRGQGAGHGLLCDVSLLHVSRRVADRSDRRGVQLLG